MTVGNRTNPFVSAPCCFRHHRCARLFRVTKAEHRPKITAYARQIGEREPED